MMVGNTNQFYNITRRKSGAVDLRNNKLNILSINKPTVAHSPIMPKALPNIASTSHYLHLDALPHCSHIVRTTSVPTVQVANGNVIKPDLRATFKISNKRSPKAQSTHVFNDLTTGYLISMEQLFNDDCIAIFTKFDVKI